MTVHVLLDLPEALALEILLIWSSLKSLAQLDQATCHRKQRENLHGLIRNKTMREAHLSSSLLAVWLTEKKLQPRILTMQCCWQCDANMSAAILTQLMHGADRFYVSVEDPQSDTGFICSCIQNAINLHSIWICADELCPINNLIQPVSTCVNLLSVTIYVHPALPVDVSELLCNCQQLELLRVWNCFVKKLCTSAFSKQLKRWDMYAARIPCIPSEAELLEIIHHCAGLQTLRVGDLLQPGSVVLSMNDVLLTDRVMSAIGTKLPNLQALHLDVPVPFRSTWSTLGTVLEGCRQLTSLTLSPCTLLSTVDLVGIMRLPKLIFLSLQQRNLTGEDITIAQKVFAHTLQDLHLRAFEQLTDTGLAAICTLCPALRKLSLHACGALTTAGVAKVLRQRQGRRTFLHVYSCGGIDTAELRKEASQDVHIC